MSAREKLSILKSWEADERALQRAEDEGMIGGEHAHLHRVQDALARLQSTSSADEGGFYEAQSKADTDSKLKHGARFTW